jgi:hypothetical protein
MERCYDCGKKFAVIFFGFYSLLSLSALLIGIIGLCNYKSDHQFRIFTELTGIGLITSSVIGLTILAVWFCDKWCKKRRYPQGYYEI